MKIGVLSDTHDRLPTFRRAVAMFRRMQVAAIFHAGDFVAPFAARVLGPEELKIPVYAVFGNNDGERAGLKKALPSLAEGPIRVSLGGRQIVMHHALEWMKESDWAEADLVISGHTHQVMNELRNGKLFLNPGECCGWLTDRPTVALVDLEKLEAQIVEVHE